jgi:hypothetical protein
MTDIVPDAFVPPLPTTVTTDIPCRKCGYNLRGLSTAARCPECGVAIAASTSGDLLRFCDPEWVNLLARGTKLIIAGVVVMFFDIVVAVILAIAMGTKQSLLTTLASLASGALIVLGSWLLTTPDPSGIGEDRYGTARKTIRITLLIGIVNTAILETSMWAPLPPMIAQAIRLLGGLVELVNIVAYYAQLHYFEKLAERIPDPPLTRRANFLKKWLPASDFVMNLGTVASLLLARNGPPQRNLLVSFGCFVGIFGLATLVLAIMYLLMIEKFGKRFKESALLASQNWAAHAADPPVA